MKEVKLYTEVDANVLKTKGILDILRTPVNGVDRHPNIPWEKLSHLTVYAMRIVDIEKQSSVPFNHLSVHFRDEDPKPVDFGLIEQPDGNFAVSTVSGAQEGHVRLGADTSAIIARLLHDSLRAGEVEVA